MKSSRNSQANSNLNILNSAVHTYRQEGTFCNDTSRLDIIENALNEIQTLCRLLQEEKNACNQLRNDCSKTIQEYQLYHTSIEAHIQSLNQPPSTQHFLSFYSDRAMVTARQYLEGKPQPPHKLAKPTDKVGKPDKSSDRSKVLRRLDKSLRSPLNRL